MELCGRTGNHEFDKIVLFGEWLLSIDVERFDHAQEEAAQFNTDQSKVGVLNAFDVEEH